jgi:glycine/D-amino acid oxidase-like deaminating enzyme
LNISYWEQNSWFNNIDYAIIGSGIVGCTCALEIRKLYPEAHITIFEKGILPSGASTKNAGFACFGSLSEILDDLQSHSIDEVNALITERKIGLETLRKLLGDDAIDYQEHGGYELFETSQIALFNNCVAQLETVNKILRPIFKEDVFSVIATPFGFQGVHSQAIFNKFEGQIDTGKMMRSLLKKVADENITIINGVTVADISSLESGCKLYLEDGVTINAVKICVTTNGFAKQLLREDVAPARAQVLITKPIKNLKIKGTFHLDRGYYYFRNIDNRILFGGGRNLDFKTEETSELGVTEIIQNRLELVLRETILPTTDFELDSRWSGIMGVGSQKKPIIKQTEDNIYCGVRLGGMGVAIGSLIGKQLAHLSK